MNKYQKALANLINESFENYNKKSIQTKEEYNNIVVNRSILQELVNRATPKKPVIDSIKIGDKPCEIYHCICGCMFLFNGNFCPQCGQAIDWSDVK